MTAETKPTVADIRHQLSAVASLPAEGETVTARQMARHFAVRAAERGRKQLDPGYGSDLDVRELACMVAEYAAAHALHMFANVSAAHADIAADQIKDAMDDGGGIGEWLWEMLGAETSEQVARLTDQLVAAIAEADAKPDAPEQPLPDGEYARVEILGHDSHTGWVTEATRAGQPVMVVKDWDGRVIAEVPGHSLYRFVPLATPLKRPEPRAAITAGTPDDDPWGGSDDDYDDDRGPF